jgi:hypothetical protein
MDSIYERFRDKRSKQGLATGLKKKKEGVDMRDEGEEGEGAQHAGGRMDLSRRVRPKLDSDDESAESGAEGDEEEEEEEEEDEEEEGKGKVKGKGKGRRGLLVAPKEDKDEKAADAQRAARVSRWFSKDSFQVTAF